MKRSLCLFTIVIFAFSFGFTITSCTKISDEFVLQKIKSAKEPSDIFQNICVGTKADTTQIRRLATSLNWEEKPLSQEQKTQLLTGLWVATVNNIRFSLLTIHGFDSEVGHVVEACHFTYGGAAEPAFVQNVISKSGLQRVSPSNQLTKRPKEAILLSDTGRESGSFLVIPIEINFFGSRTVQAFAIRPNN